MAQYKVICAGTRDFTDEEYIFKVLDHYLGKIPPSEVTILNGLARGPDKIGGLYADARKMKQKEFPALWDDYGSAAGFIRNEQMAKEGTHLIAFWDGISRGTKDMIDRALKKRLRVVIIRLQRIDSHQEDTSNVESRDFRRGPSFARAEKQKSGDPVPC